MTRDQYLNFAKKTDYLPSIKLAAQESGFSIPEIKKYMKIFYKPEEDEEEEKRGYDWRDLGFKNATIDKAMWEWMQTLCANNAADLYVAGKISESQFLEYLKDNSIDKCHASFYKEQAESRKKDKEIAMDVRKKKQKNLKCS